MKEALLNLLREHWPLVVPAALGFALGWAVHRQPPQPAVALDTNTEARKAFEGTSQTVADMGPKRTTIDETTEYDAWPSTTPPTPPDCPARQLIPVPMPGPVRTVRHTVVEEGPAVVRTVVAERAQEQETQHVSLTVTPAASPRWALGAGIEDPLGLRRVNLSLGMRVIGPVWLRAGITPARGAPGATIGAEVQW